MKKVIGWIRNNKVTAFIILWLILGLIAFIIYWVTFKGVNWGVLTGVATWVLSAGVFFAFSQVQQARKSTNAQIAVDLFNKLRSVEIKETLRFIYSLDRETLPLIYFKDLYKIENIFDIFELLGALVNMGIVDERLAIEAYAGPPALRCWYQLASFLREKEKERGFYIINYEDFVRRSVEYYKNNNVPVIFRRFDRKNVNLVKQFQELIDKKDELRPRTLEEIRREKLSNKK